MASLFLKFLLHLCCVCVFIYTCAYMHNLQESVRSFHHVDVRLRSKQLCPLSHLGCLASVVTLLNSHSGDGTTGQRWAEIQ